MKNLFIIIPLILSLYSCRSVETVTVTEYRDRYITNTRLDSIFLYKQDSIVILQRGDTIFKDRWKTLVKERIVTQTDTCFIETEKITIQHVEKKESRISTFLRHTGAVSFSALFVLLLYVILTFFRKKL